MLERNPQDPFSWIVTLCIREFLNFDEATAASESQSSSRLRFKNILQVEYDQPDQGDLFDMATGRYLSRNLVLPVHIFLYKWRHRISYYSTIDNVDDVRNGLLLCRPVEWAFNRAKVCIEVDDAGMMLFRLLDHDLSDVKLFDEACELRRESGEQPTGNEEDLQMTFGDLDGREVLFPTGSKNRPSPRLLGIHAVAAWIVTRSYACDSELPIPKINALDGGTYRPSLDIFVDAWRHGVSELLSIF